MPPSSLLLPCLATRGLMVNRGLMATKGLMATRGHLVNPLARGFHLSPPCGGWKDEELKKRQTDLMKRGLPTRRRIEGVGQVVVVASGKGGVGKSTTAVNLALALASTKGKPKVGLLDADIFGPSLPTMMGISEQPLLDSRDKMLPVESLGLACMSMGLLVDPKAAVVWRGPMVMGALDKLVHGTAWEGTDILVVDTPPGTGDIHLSLAQTVHLAGAVIVSTPQKVALADARKGVDMFRKMEVPILGLVENMSGFLCPSCGTVTRVFGEGGVAELAVEEGVEVLGGLPLDPQLMAASDSGRPLLLSHPASPVAAELRRIAANLLATLHSTPSPTSNPVSW